MTVGLEKTEESHQGRPVRTKVLVRRHRVISLLEEGWEGLCVCAALSYETEALLCPSCGPGMIYGVPRALGAQSFVQAVMLDRALDPTS